MLVGLVILVVLGLVGSLIGGGEVNWTDRGRRF